MQHNPLVPPSTLFPSWRRDHSQGLTVPNQDQAYFLQLMTGILGLIWMAKAAFQRRYQSPHYGQTSLYSLKLARKLSLGNWQCCGKTTYMKPMRGNWSRIQSWQQNAEIGVGRLYAIHLKLGAQGRSQPHSPGWARVPLSSFFPQILIIFVLFFLKLFSFSSSFWLSGWATRPTGKALATPLWVPWLRCKFFPEVVTRSWLQQKRDQVC